MSADETVISQLLRSFRPGMASCKRSETVKAFSKHKEASAGREGDTDRKTMTRTIPLQERPCDRQLP